MAKGEEHARDRVMAAVLAHPGTTRTRLAEATGLAWGTLGHHLRKLSSEGRVSSIRVGRCRHFMPAAFAHTIQGYDPLADPLARRIITAIAESACPTGPSGLSRATETTARRVQGQLEQLAQAGLVATDGGYHPRYQLTPRGQGSVQAIKRAPTARLDLPDSSVTLYQEGMGDEQ